MSDEQRDLAAAAALGALSDDELARLEQEAVRSPQLAAQLDEDRETVAMLEASLAREEPPAGLFDSVLGQIERESAPTASPAAEAVKPRRSPRARRFWPAFAAGAATAAVAAVLLVVLTGRSDLGPPDAVAAVSGTEEFPAVQGEARLYRVDEGDGVLVVDLSDVPPPAPGQHYEVWVLRKQAGGAMEAVGSFASGGAAVDLELPLPGAGSYEAVDVSVEPDGGSAEHSGRSLAGGRFEATT